MSVPLPATLVDTVIVFPMPAFAIVYASSFNVFASNLLYSMPNSSSLLHNCSERLTEILPTNEGRPADLLSMIALIIASSFCCAVLNMRNGRSLRINGL